MAEATARAHPNIALAKYWGKLDAAENLPATPSLSLTLAGLATQTRVSFEQGLTDDVVWLNGVAASDTVRSRVIRLLNRVRERAGHDTKAKVESANDFPTAAGLASSSSGFAALALAASRASGLELSQRQVSALARASSASAARSVFGGFVSLDAGASHAELVARGSEFPLAMVVCVVRSAPKPMSSTEGMLHTQATSPYYPAWLSSAPKLYQEIMTAIRRRDIERLGEAVEQSAMMMHATMWSARPALNYFLPATLSVLSLVREIRASGLPAYPTIDAGPNVKVLTLPEHAEAIVSKLRTLPEVEDLFCCESGADAQFVERD